MKILERGNNITSWKKTLTCLGNGGSHTKTACGSTLEVEYSDLYYWKGYSDDGWGGSPSAVCFKCIECGAVTDIPREIWPISYHKLPVATWQWITSSEHAEYIAKHENI